MRCTINPGRGDFPVGQFDAQNLFPNGNGIPSLANSMNEELITNSRNLEPKAPWLTRDVE